MNKKTTGRITTLLAALLTTAGLAGCAGTAPTNIGLNDNRLAPCPSSPNCVCSYDKDEGHTIAPILLKGSTEETKVALLAALEAMGATVVSAQGPYIRSEFTSSLMGFVDDVEFYIEASGIQVRSASRLGHSDFSANRKRVENIRLALHP
ncbi:MAG: DUF1499 domain-containing protein [Pseudomonadales bacterium]|nr:DUF1499 domain-containing protein [Pseudomonadales bacterium]